jgi:hypothetical protein
MENDMTKTTSEQNKALVLEAATGSLAEFRPKEMPVP